MSSNTPAINASAVVECFPAKQPTRQPPPIPPRPKNRRPQRPKLTVDTHIARLFDLDDTPIFLRQTAASSPRWHAAAAGLAPHLRQYATALRDDVWIGPDRLHLEQTSLPRFSSTAGPALTEPEQAAEEAYEKPLPPPPPIQECRPPVFFPPTPVPDNYPWQTPGLSLSRQNSMQKTPERFYFPPSQVPWAEGRVHFEPNPSPNPNPPQHTTMKMVRKLTQYIHRTPSFERELAQLSACSTPSSGSDYSSPSSTSTRFRGSPISAARLGYASPQLHPDLLPHPEHPAQSPPPHPPPAGQPNQPPPLTARQTLRLHDPDSPSTARCFAFPPATAPDPLEGPLVPVSSWSPLGPPTPLLPALSPRSRGRVGTVVGVADEEVEAERRGDGGRRSEKRMVGMLRGFGRGSRGKGTSLARLAGRRFGVE